MPSLTTHSAILRNPSPRLSGPPELPQPSLLPSRISILATFTSPTSTAISLTSSTTHNILLMLPNMRSPLLNHSPSLKFLRLALLRIIVPNSRAMFWSQLANMMRGSVVVIVSHPMQAGRIKLRIRPQRGLLSSCIWELDMG